jgi:Flp pilus assembly protein TadB
MSDQTQISKEQASQAGKLIAAYRDQQKVSRQAAAEQEAILQRQRTRKRVRQGFIFTVCLYVVPAAFIYWPVMLTISGVFAMVFAWRLANIVGPYARKYLAVKAEKEQGLRINYYA